MKSSSDDFHYIYQYHATLVFGSWLFVSEAYVQPRDAAQYYSVAAAIPSALQTTMHDEL